MKTNQHSEPDFQQACGWWEDLTNIWTPVGWKDHLVQFSVFWDGMILAEPCLNRRSQQWKNQGAQISFIPKCNPTDASRGYTYLRQDDRSVNQGWNNTAAPVLWTEWNQDGVLLRQEVFAHIPGGGDVKSGDEPLFAWIRLSVRDLCPSLPIEETHGFNIFIDKGHISGTMSMRNNIAFKHHEALYPGKLMADCSPYSKPQGLRLCEEDGRIRLGIAPHQAADGSFFEPPTEKNQTNRLYVKIPARKGARIDLLLPMIPMTRDIFDAEMTLGYDGALREANRYWKEITTCRTRFEVPESAINEVIKHSVRFSNVLTEKNPATGRYCKINGSWAYANLWTTPMAMDLVMMMDLLGHHATVERYLDVFREEQGTVVPPGDAYELHPGYLSTPALYKSIDWLSDHGAVLYTLCMHALLSGDRAFTERFTECIVKACEWIQQARQKTGHDGYAGVLPPAVATDAKTKIQAVWSIGWNYLGLTKAVKVLKQIGHPRAAEFEREAVDYKQAFLKGFRDKCRRMPTWKDARGRRHRFVPTALVGDNKAENRHGFYLDTGALFLVFAGLMDAREPLMKDTCLWFRAGPQWKHHRRDSNCWQVPVLDHEMSSCEPTYSWNVFHPWQLGDRQKFLEGMYSLFAGSVSRKTFVSCETRGGITGNVFSAPLAIYMARLAVIDDQLRNDELHLLRLMPLAWLRPGARAVFEQMPTEFGPVSLTTQINRRGDILDICFTPKWRGAAPKVILHLPPLAGLKGVRVNGQRLKVKGRKILLQTTAVNPERNRLFTQKLPRAA